MEMASKKILAPADPVNVAGFVLRGKPVDLLAELERGPSLRAVAARLGVSRATVRRVVAWQRPAFAAFFFPASLVRAWADAEKRRVSIEADLCARAAILDVQRVHRLVEARRDAEHEAAHYLRQLEARKTRAPKLYAKQAGQFSATRAA